jgi:hypothetical protein
MSPSVLRARSLAGFLGLIAAFALTAVHAQAGCVYNFSEYNNGYLSSDGSTLYYSVSAVDNSGCGHSDYTTVANIQAPDGTVFTSSASGLASTLSTTEDMASGGDYSAYTQGFFYCPYAGAVVNGWGTGLDLKIEYRYTYWTNPIYYPLTDECDWQNTACTPGTTKTCGSAALTVNDFPFQCPAYVRAKYPVLIENGVVLCSPVITPPTPVSGPGPCT